MSVPTRILIAGAALASLSAVAFAQASTAPPPPAAAGRGHGMHRHQPGQQPVTRAALQTMLEQRFDAMDANHDGTLTPDERRAAFAQRRTQRRDAAFAKLDSNHDGSISRAEFDAARPERPARMDAAAGHNWRQRGMWHGAAMMRGEFAAFRNQPVTRTQFVEAGLARFDRVDTNHDGVISSAERDAARRAMRDRPAPATPQPPPPGQ